MFSTMRNQPAWNLDDPFMAHHGFPRERHHSGSSGGTSTASTGEERVIPIQILRDDPPKAQQQQSQPQPPMRGKSPSPPAHAIPQRLPEEPMAAHPPSTVGPQRCNTDPNHSIFAEEARATRAQSAPPVSQNGNEKLSAKLSIDPNDMKPQGMQAGGNCSKNTKPGENPANVNAAGGVRSIPIFVEGRKGSANASANGSSCSGQSPPQAKVSRPAERSPTPPPKKPAPPKDPMDKVTAVMDEVKEFEKKVDEFQGNSREDRGYLVLDEMLTRCLIKLDVVEADGRDDVRTARKECIRYIQSCISKLEKKVPLPPQPEENDESEQAMDVAAQESKETEQEAKSTASSNQTMEIDSNLNTNKNSEETCEEQQKPVKELISAFSANKK